VVLDSVQSSAKDQEYNACSCFDLARVSGIFRLRNSLLRIIVAVPETEYKQLLFCESATSATHAAEFLSCNLDSIAISSRQILLTVSVEDMFGS
jgi:hypothetical protein